MDIFVQGPAWAQFQRKRGRRVHEAKGEGWHFLAIEEPHRLGPHLYLPYGPVADDPAALTRALEAAVGLAHQRRALWLRVEPRGPARQETISTLQAAGFRAAPRTIQPEHTRIIDLARPWDEVFADMHSTVRRIYRNYQKKDVSIVASHDIADLPISVGIIHGTAERNHFTAFEEEYLRTALEVFLPLEAATIYLQYWRETPIGTVIVYDSADTRCYMHVGNDGHYRSLNVGSALVVQLIADAHARGLRYVDMWGVCPPGATDHPWAGFSAFKAKFGGEVDTYGGTWDLPVRPLVYTGYRRARAAATQVRRLRSRALASAPPQAADPPPRSVVEVG